MIKILKHGKKKIPTYIYKAKCGTCGCKFLYEDNDIRYCNDEARYVACPQCNHSQFILFKRRCKGSTFWDRLDKKETK